MGRQVAALRHDKRVDAQNLQTAQSEKDTLASKVKAHELRQGNLADEASRLKTELQLAQENLAKEREKSTVLLDLTRSMIDDQSKLRESLLPAIGVPPDIYLDIKASDGIMKIDQDVIREAISGPLKTAGFTVLDKVPDDRQFMWLQFRFDQLPVKGSELSAYSVSLECFAQAWHSGAVRAMPFFSRSSFGYAGSKSKYGTSVREAAAAFTDMLIEPLGKIDSAAQEIDSDMLDANHELAQANSRLNILDPDPAFEFESTGSGFLVSPQGLIVTNRHVVSEQEHIKVWIPSCRAFHDAALVGTDVLSDLALLRLTGDVKLPDSLKFPAVSDEGVAVGQAATTVGFPLPKIMGKEPKLSAGIINALSGYRDDSRFFQHSIPIQPGNSGGLLLSETGIVCGVVQSTLNALAMLGESGSLPQNVNYAIKSNRLLSFARSLGCDDELAGSGRSPISPAEAARLAVMVAVQDQ